MKTKVCVISGFLGAGKTTLIKKLLEGKLRREKIVIIENEFGEIGIDGSRLKSSGIEVRELNSGCICCTLAGDFTNTISEVITKYKPDRILIEPSGVAKLSDIIQACSFSQLRTPIILNTIITVVDVYNYFLYQANFGEFFQNQITHAKTVILSKTAQADLALVESVARSIRKSNPRANVVTTPWERLEPDLILAAAEGDALQELAEDLRQSYGQIPGHEHSHKHSHSHQHTHSADHSFSVWGAETPRIYSEWELKSILSELENRLPYGTVLRSKGILQLKDHWINFDFVPGRCEVTDAQADYTGRLCVIGKNLNKDNPSRLFHVGA